MAEEKDPDVVSSDESEQPDDTEGQHVKFLKEGDAEGKSAEDDTEGEGFKMVLGETEDDTEGHHAKKH